MDIACVAFSAADFVMSFLDVWSATIVMIPVKFLVSAVILASVKILPVTVARSPINNPKVDFSTEATCVVSTLADVVSSIHGEYGVQTTRRH